MHVIAYPKSGNNWILYIIKHFTNVELELEHGHTEKFLDKIADDNKKIFLVRNYKEAIIKFIGKEEILKFTDLKNVDLYTKQKNKVDYLSLLSIYDCLPESKKILMYYEDFIGGQTFAKELKRLLNFLDCYNDEKYKNFIENFELYKKESLSLLNKKWTSDTKGDINKILYHSKKLTEEEKIRIDKYVKNKAPDIFEKYLKRYAEAE